MHYDAENISIRPQNGDFVKMKRRYDVKNVEIAECLYIFDGHGRPVDLNNVHNAQSHTGAYKQFYFSSLFIFRHCQKIHCNQLPQFTDFVCMVLTSPWLRVKWYRMFSSKRFLITKLWNYACIMFSKKGKRKTENRFLECRKCQWSLVVSRFYGCAEDCSFCFVSLKQYGHWY